jgi:hypothetical protein
LPDVVGDDDDEDDDEDEDDAGKAPAKDATAEAKPDGKTNGA